jgi:hypothetical protein
VPFFRVQMHGRGVALAFAGDVDPAIGFYCHRDVHAADTVLAQEVAIAKVLDEWRGDGSYAAANRGNVPTIHVDACWRLSWWRGLLGGRSAGYTFYSRED